MTREGKEAAFSFAHDAARNGVTVVSGLAYGIDASAHAGAVDAVSMRWTRELKKIAERLARSFRAERI